VPLIELLSNGQFTTELGRLLDRRAVKESAPVDALSSCRCGCGQGVAAGRKFVSQVHYNAWLGRVRYFGRHAWQRER
jgi:hypothetical protein